MPCRFANERSRWSCLALLIICSSTLAAGPKVNGRLESFGNISALRVWGTPKEMGFAHGYLLADRVLDSASFDYQGKSADERAVRDAMRSYLAGMLVLPPRVEEELEGILAGVKAKLGDQAGQKELGRPLNMSDLRFWTGFDAIRAVACSGFTVWGDRAGDAGVITTRNFDFELLGSKMLDRQILLIREPDGRNKVAMVTLAGYIGAFTGINEKGVCSFIHDGSGESTIDGFSSIKPLIPQLTEWLETTTPADAPKSAHALLKELGRYPFSYMFRVVTPRVGDSPPERVFHIDTSGIGENAAGNGVCITTNHYVLAQLKPDDRADAWSKKRFNRLEDETRNPLTSADVWKAMESVAWSDARTGTLHTVVVYPELRKMELAFAAVEDGRLIPAPKRGQVTITFDELFNKPHD
ncbi:MAG: hypothetical protein J5J06_17330 [Phycisphaerae bacterium]|nr:hypothetical protein [Phycisphaerae bacterium]